MLTCLRVASQLETCNLLQRREDTGIAETVLDVRCVQAVVLCSEESKQKTRCDCIAHVVLKFCNPAGFAAVSPFFFECFQLSFLLFSTSCTVSTHEPRSSHCDTAAREDRDWRLLLLLRQQERDALSQTPHRDAQGSKTGPSQPKSRRESGWKHSLPPCRVTPDLLQFECRLSLVLPCSSSCLTRSRAVVRLSGNQKTTSATGRESFDTQGYCLKMWPATGLISFLLFHGN